MRKLPPKHLPAVRRKMPGKVFHTSAHSNENPRSNNYISNPRGDRDQFNRSRMVQDQLAKRMSPTKRRAVRPRNGGRAVFPTVDNRGLAVLQLNVEGLTTPKLEVVRHLADSNGAAAVLLQETHCTSDNFL
ncbi:hypothetical protein NQZ68_011455 [Dissostichus eleginoides]|nr:hypothetical protein NQZ68_011455 [Dissostichus eleginoides]